MENRIGIGYDIHRLVPDRKLIIGGIEIPFLLGLLGHSDGDVLIHAICDAILGAMAERDIGEQFPDTDPEYHGISSVELLKKVAGFAQEKNYRVINIDATLIAQEPKLIPFKRQIQENLAQILNIEKDCIGIKAKTNEGLGEIGRKEAIACYAVALLDAGGKL
jgi:2-C-methyl-D-erythritol 2,4-cyclodiphosphate synthase